MDRRRYSAVGGALHAAHVLRDRSGGQLLAQLSTLAVCGDRGSFAARQWTFCDRPLDLCLGLGVVGASRRVPDRLVRDRLVFPAS